MNKEAEDLMLGFKERMDERVDTLCAVYGTKKVRQVVTIFLAVDSLTSIVGALVSHQEVPVEAVEGMARAAAVISQEAIVAAGIPEDRMDSLMDDLFRLAKFKLGAENDLADLLGD